MLKKIIAILLFLIFNTSKDSKALTLLIKDSASVVHINKAYGNSYLINTKNCFLAPTKWNRNECILAGGFVVTGLALYTQDKEIQRLYQNYRTTFKDDASHYFFERMGSGTISLPLMGVFYLHGLIYKNDRSKEVALLGTEAYLLAGLIVSVPKYAFQRHRPFQDTPSNPRFWEGPKKGYTHYTSFPSGHTTTAFAMAAVIATEYKQTELVSIAAYSVATLVGMSRINDNKHWASDVLIGAGLGYGIGKLIANHSPWDHVTGSRKKKVPRSE